MYLSRITTLAHAQIKFDGAVKNIPQCYSTSPLRSPFISVCTCILQRGYSVQPYNLRCRPLFPSFHPTYTHESAGPRDSLPLSQQIFLLKTSRFLLGSHHKNYITPDSSSPIRRGSENDWTARNSKSSAFKFLRS